MHKCYFGTLFKQLVRPIQTLWIPLKSDSNNEGYSAKSFFEVVRRVWTLIVDFG